MAGISLVWKGPEVSRHLRAKLAPRVKRAAERVAARARANAPVRSGDLRRSIAVVPTDNPLDFRIVATVPYASFVEFGASGHAANPFLRRALGESVNDVRTTFQGR
jgi:HK97 gp10 family phage protein